jgi:hypothetical protein
VAESLIYHFAQVEVQTIWGPDSTLATNLYHHQIVSICVFVSVPFFPLVHVCNPRAWKMNPGFLKANLSEMVSLRFSENLCDIGK